MKYIIYFLAIFVLVGCHQKSPIRISTDKWNQFTYNAILNNIEIDTGCYADSTIPQLEINGNEIGSFKEHLFYFLRKREALVSCLMNDSVFNNTSEIYIKEFIGEGGGIPDNYNVLVGTIDHAKSFTLSSGFHSSSNAFISEEKSAFNLEGCKYFYSEFSNCSFYRMRIASVFTSSDSVTRCKILGVQIE